MNGWMDGWMDGYDRWIYRQTDRQTSRQTDKETDRQTDRQTVRQTDRQTDRQILDDLRPVNREGSYQGETTCIPTTSKNSDLIKAHSTVEDWETVGENEVE